jgi:hypothetical protein
MTQEEHLLCEIEEFKLELQQSKVRMKHIERFIRAKETELQHLKTKSSKNSLYSSLYNHGAIIENCDTICEVVKNWLPDRIDYNDEYCSGWNDYRNTLLENIK